MWSGLVYHFGWRRRRAPPAIDSTVVGLPQAQAILRVHRDSLHASAYAGSGGPSDRAGAEVHDLRPGVPARGSFATERPPAWHVDPAAGQEIGRASCRERV